MFARICFFCLVLLASPGFSQDIVLPNSNISKNPRVDIDTSHGKIVLELFADKAPATVNNFLVYVQSGHYDNTIIHRIARDFVIQVGAYDTKLAKKAQHNAIALEKTTEVSNRRGSIAAARKMADSNSATSEFFINLVDNPQLDFQSDISPLNQGFAVFGQIVEDIEVIDKIRKLVVQDKPGFPGLPVSPVVNRSIKRVTEKS
jgi:peptidyl-prolyl cis-trans isomerase A (cyclophilin A)